MVRKTQTTANIPTWLNLKTIIIVLGMLGFGGGGYLAKEATSETQVVEKKVIESFDIEQFGQSILESMRMQSDAQREKDRNQNTRIEDLYDEVRTNYADYNENMKLVRRDLKEIKECLKEQNLTDLQRENLNGLQKFDNLTLEKFDNLTINRNEKIQLNN